MPRDITKEKFLFNILNREEIKVLELDNPRGWAFNWLKPYSKGYEIYALSIETKSRIQGLIALKGNSDPDFMCVDVELIESAPQNKKIINGQTNQNREFSNCGRLLVAFACHYSFIKGYDGYVELTSKSSKFPFYESLGAKRTYGQNVYFDTDSANKLVTKYF